MTPGYLFRILSSVYVVDHAVANSSGTNLPRTSFIALGEFEFGLPPLAEQRRIVAKIEALKSRSRKTREALEAIPPLLEQFRQSALAAAFRGDLTASWREQHPDSEPASVLLERIRTERRRKWEQAELAKFKAKGKVPKDDSWKERYVDPEPVDDSDLPELPEGWCWATWNELSEWITYGFTRPMPHVEDGVPIITAKNVVDGQVQFDDTHFTTVGAFRALSDKDRPEPGDILITKDGTIGRAAVVPKGTKFCINQSVAVVYLRSCPIDRRYLLRAIEAPMTQDPIREKARGMALQHLSITDFGRMAVPLPPMTEQLALVSSIETQLGRLEHVSAAVSDVTDWLTQCDQSILAKAFRGDLVPQDPNDEPASLLLERIRAERAEHTNSTPARGRRKRSSDATTDATANDEDGPTDGDGNGQLAAVSRRPIDDYTANELMIYFRSAIRGAGDMTEDDLLRDTAQRLGFERLSPKVRTGLQGHLRTAIRRGIVRREDGIVGAATSTFRRYSDELLSKIFTSVMRPGCDYDRDDVVRAVAEYLGYSQVTMAMRERMKSVFNSAIRREIIVRRGPKAIAR